MITEDLFYDAMNRIEDYCNGSSEYARKHLLVESVARTEFNRHLSDADIHASFMIALLMESFGNEDEKYWAVSNFIFFSDFGKKDKIESIIPLSNGNNIALETKSHKDVYDLWKFLIEK